MCPMKSKFKLSTIMVLGLNLKWRLDTLEKTVSEFCGNKFLFGIRSELWKMEKIKQTGKFENEHVLFKVSITGAVTFVILFYSVAQVIN